MRYPLITRIATVATTLLALACGKKDKTNSFGNNDSSSESTNQKQQEQVNLSGCVQLTTGGVNFSADNCVLNETVGGAVFCNDPLDRQKCAPMTVRGITIESRQPNDKISKISIANIKNGNGPYQADPDAGKSDFEGRLLDGNGTEHKLLKGMMTLESLSYRETRITFDALFSENIQVKGSGLLKTEVLAAP